MEDYAQIDIKSLIVMIKGFKAIKDKEGRTTKKKKWIKEKLQGLKENSKLINILVYIFSK